MFKKEREREEGKICLFENGCLCCFTFSPAEATGRFHPSVRWGGSTPLAAAASASSLAELRMGAPAANVSSLLTVASPHFMANQKIYIKINKKEAANTSQEHRTMPLHYICFDWRYTKPNMGKKNLINIEVIQVISAVCKYCHTRQNRGLL